MADLSPEMNPVPEQLINIIPHVKTDIHTYIHMYVRFEPVV